MKKEDMKKLYGLLGYTAEAFMSTEVKHEVEHDVVTEGDTVESTYYKVVMNPNEMITAAEILSIRNLLGEILVKNGVDLSTIKGGRSDEDLANADWSRMECRKKIA